MGPDVVIGRFKLRGFEESFAPVLILGYLRAQFKDELIGEADIYIGRQENIAEKFNSCG